MVSVTQAFVIDLTGQVCTGERSTASSTAASRPALLHRGALASRTARGRMPLLAHAGRRAGDQSVLRAEEAVPSPGRTHWVVTEYGTAYLFDACSRSEPRR